jgi:hypothetical protein
MFNMTHTVKVPALNLVNTIEFVKGLYSLPKADKYIFDFSAANHFEPISLLYLSSEIRFCRDRHPERDFRASNYKSSTYAAHMGFFQAFGLNFGSYPTNDLRGWNNTTYIPIRILDADEVRKAAAERMLPVGEYIDNVVKDLTKILVQDTSVNTYGVLAYSLREIFRNVVEHSETGQFAFCAQYWPSKHKASLAILDRGIGIKASLSDNPYLNIETDFEAIQQALLPGISGKMYKGKKKNHYDHWQNSGYGLYMTSEICKKGGSFFIASGHAAMKFEAEVKQTFELFVPGTLIEITIDTNQIAKVENMLMELSSNVKTKKGSLKPSKASTTFHSKGKT